MNFAHIQSLKALLETPQHIVLVPHKNPDGDAIGSTLALMHYLKQEGHDVALISPNGFPDFLKWMPGADEIVIFEQDRQASQEILKTATLVFTLDFNSLDRTGSMQTALEACEASFVMIAGAGAGAWDV